MKSSERKFHIGEIKAKKSPGSKKKLNCKFMTNKEIEKHKIAAKKLDKVDKFKETKIKILKSRYSKSPLIKDATINLECKLKKEIDLGDHIMFIGKILAAYINPGRKILLNAGKIKEKRVFREF